VSTAPLPVGTYVLYRDADRFLAGLPDHTRIGRVVPDATYITHADFATVQFLDGDMRVLRAAPRAYLRVIPAAEIMADIDTAPLALLDQAGPLSAAAAWLVQSRRSTALAITS